MNSSTQTFPEQALEQRKSASIVTSGALSESLASGVALILAIIGLSGRLPSLLLSVAVIAMGAAFLFEGIALSSRFSKLLAETSKDRLDKAEFGVGVTSEFLGGFTGVVLGILSLLQIAPMSLIPVSLIVYGVTFMLSSGSTDRLNAIELEGAAESTRYRKIAYEAMRSATFLEFVLGMSAVILGTIALVGTSVAVISLVGMLVVSVSGLLTGAAVTTRMLSLLRG